MWSREWFILINYVSSQSVTFPTLSPLPSPVFHNQC